MYTTEIKYNNERVCYIFVYYFLVVLSIFVLIK